MHYWWTRMSKKLRLCAALCIVASGVGCGGGKPAVDVERAPPDAALNEASDAFADRTVSDLIADAAALEVAEALFSSQCAGCHGSDGSGSVGVADLTRGGFDWGNTTDAIRKTIRDGRRTQMPAMGGVYGEVEIGQLVSYVQALGSDEPLSDFQQRGKGFYDESCVECHGERGDGNSEMGVPSLTDDYWQHGSNKLNIRLTITRGVEADCPGHADVLTSAQIELLTAFVLNLSGGVR